MVLQREHIIVAIVYWTEEGKKILGFKPSVVTRDDLESVRNTAIWRHATVLYRSVEEWIQVIQNQIKEGYVMNIRELLYSNETGEITGVVEGFAVTKNGKKIAKDVNWLIRKYGGDYDDIMYGIGYDVIHRAEMHAKAVDTYLSKLCDYKYYMERSEEGEKCMERLERVRDFVELEFDDYEPRFSCILQPLFCYLVFRDHRDRDYKKYKKSYKKR